MNQELASVIRLYSTGSHPELNTYLLSKSKDNIIGILDDLLTMYINDKNSSTLREFITVIMAGYEHKEGKIGYNGFKHDTFVSGKTACCEAKPKNYDTHSTAKNPPKLKGAGNFSDYTFARLNKDLKEENLHILSSGFVDGKLIYVLEFPFNCPSFVSNLSEQLEKRFPEGDIPNEYLRSASFDHRDYIECDNLKVAYVLGKQKLDEYKTYIAKDFYNFLEAHAE